MNKERPSRLRFNLGFLIEATVGTSRTMELDYPTIQVADDVTLTPLQGQFQMTRTSEGVYLSGDLHSNIETDCVRCLTMTHVPITIRLDELFYYPPATAPAGMHVVGENGFIDLSPLVRELGLLEVPMHLLCRPDCKGLCVECGQNLNEKDCGHRLDEIDPRFAALKKLLDS